MQYATHFKYMTAYPGAYAITATSLMGMAYDTEDHREAVATWKNARWYSKGY